MYPPLSRDGREFLPHARTGLEPGGAAGEAVLVVPGGGPPLRADEALKARSSTRQSGDRPGKRGFTMSAAGSSRQRELGPALGEFSPPARGKRLAPGGSIKGSSSRLHARRGSTLDSLKEFEDS